VAVPNCTVVAAAAEGTNAVPISATARSGALQAATTGHRPPVLRSNLPRSGLPAWVDGATERRTDVWREVNMTAPSCKAEIDHRWSRTFDLQPQVTLVI
jgi:hypothetical protein